MIGLLKGLPDEESFVFTEAFSSPSLSLFNHEVAASASSDICLDFQKYSKMQISEPYLVTGRGSVQFAVESTQGTVDDVPTLGQVRDFDK